MPRDQGNIILSEIVPVILAGGAGKRLWPLSTPAKPKPFLKIFSGRTLLQKTARRVTGLQKPYVVCHERHRALVMEQMDAGQIILEPTGRGTAPALAATAYYLSRQGNPLMLVMPSDHAIARPDKLLKSVSRGLDAAREGWLVTFGITPRNPSPHYGYIRAGQAIGADIYAVDSFTEKPEKPQARQYLQEGGYLWNSGIFLFSAQSYLDALEKHQPDIYRAATQAVNYASRLQNSIFLNESSFSACPALSIDYAVMEKSQKTAVIPTSLKWRDLGTWPSLFASYFDTFGR